MRVVWTVIPNPEPTQSNTFGPLIALGINGANVTFPDGWEQNVFMECLRNAKGQLRFDPIPEFSDLNTFIIFLRNRLQQKFGNNSLATFLSKCDDRASLHLPGPVQETILYAHEAIQGLLRCIIERTKSIYRGKQMIATIPDNSSSQNPTKAARTHIEKHTGSDMSGTWETVAKENGKVTLPVGTLVRYGFGTKWVHRKIESSSAFTANNAVFGDPIFGTSKILQVLRKAVTTSALDPMGGVDSSRVTPLAPGGSPQENTRITGLRSMGFDEQKIGVARSIISGNPGVSMEELIEMMTSGGRRKTRRKSKRTYQRKNKRRS